MKSLKLRETHWASLILLVLAAGACGGKKKAQTNSSTLTASQALVVSQNFPSLHGNGGEFATSVAVSGNLAVVGAPGDTNPSGKYTGTAYVLQRQADQTWAVIQKLHPPASMTGTVTNQGFGTSVAIDGETIFVGAPLHPKDGNPRG